MALTYTNYLKVDELLELQAPLSSPEEHDETLFIIIHQVYELWFKQILHEVDHLKSLLGKQDLVQSPKVLSRILRILKTMVSQLDILETMTPLEFQSFRARLESASGFQSYQFREFEFVLGWKRADAVERYPGHSKGRERLQKRLEEPSIWQHFLEVLKHQGFAIPESLLNQDVTLKTEPSSELQSILVDVYRNHPALMNLCERLVDLDEGVQEWRYRHVKMVERTIGMKQGTGGSSGSGYLRSTLFQPVFPDLWAIRTQF